MVCLRRCRKTTCRGGWGSCGCCGDALVPNRITGTVVAVTGGAAGCSFEVGNSVSIPLQTGLECDWEGFQNIDFALGSIGCATSFRVACTGSSASGFASSWTGGASGALDTPTLLSASCDPFSLTFRYTLVAADVACCGGVNTAGTFDITWTA